MATMYDNMLRLPLFQGICREDFTKILEKIKIRFFKYDVGKNIIHAGDVCDKLIFLLNGEIVSSFSFEKDFIFTEYLPAPYLLEPYFLYGANVHFVSSYTAHTEIELLIIEKSFVTNELFNYEIFKLNYLNTISSYAQVFHSYLRNGIPDTAEGKIVHFILTHSACPNGKKRIAVKMARFAQYLNETRMNISKALHTLEEKSLIELHRKEIIIPKIENLIETTNKNG
jgi:CRP-like cAMP-binding protein